MRKSILTLLVLALLIGTVACNGTDAPTATSAPAATDIPQPTDDPADSGDDAPAADNAVRAIIFFSPTCPHCETVIQNLLIPMIEEYGQDTLIIVAIDTSTESGQAIYQSAIEAFQIPDDRRGVPTLIIEDTVLVGSGEIPDQFPGLVEDALNASGTDWPAIPGFEPPAG